MTPPDTRIPVSVIGGFLGAGKTTLVNHLVDSSPLTFGIIVNEFGETGIDGSLIENVADDGVAELSNGCLCCFGRDDLVTALVKLATREKKPDYVLIELSGVADPVPVAQTVLDPYVKTLFALDGIIGVADARNLAQTVQETPEGAVQLAYATSIVLNKTDLATAEGLERARSILGKLNPLAEVSEVSMSQVAPERVLNLKGFEPNWELEHTTGHTKGLKSFTLKSSEPLNRQAFNSFVSRFIVDRPDAVYRAKGFLTITEFDKAVLFQSVRDIFSLKLSDRPITGESQLVIIGRNLDRAEYEEAFAATVKQEDGWLGRLLRRKQRKQAETR